MIIDGHPVFQNQGLIEMSDYIVWLTTLPATLRSRGCSPESLDFYSTRISPFIQAITKSRNIIKIDAASPQRNIVKKLIALILRKDLGLKQPGRALGDVMELQEFSRQKCFKGNTNMEAETHVTISRKIPFLGTCQCVMI